MTPGCATAFGATGNRWVVIKLIVPDHVKERPVIYFVEGRSERVRGRISDTITALLKYIVFAARIDELLTEGVITLRVSPKGAGSTGGRTPWKSGSVELKDKPPIDWMILQ